MISVLICDPQPKTPQYDWQVWTYLGWSGFAFPLGRRLGEWAWVGRVAAE
jgi:hypothetical protein